MSPSWPHAVPPLRLGLLARRPCRRAPFSCAIARRSRATRTALSNSQSGGTNSARTQVQERLNERRKRPIGHWCVLSHRYSTHTGPTPTQRAQHYLTLRTSTVHQDSRAAQPPAAPARSNGSHYSTVLVRAVVHRVRAVPTGQYYCTCSAHKASYAACRFASWSADACFRLHIHPVPPWWRSCTQFTGRALVAPALPLG